MEDTRQDVTLSRQFNRHHIAKRVLERHMTELERKHASMSSMRDEHMKSLQRELMNLHSVSSPDLLGVRNSPHLSSRGSLRANNLSSLLLREEVPSRLYSRRQSEPMTSDTATANAVSTMLQTNLSLNKDHSPRDDVKIQVKSVSPEKGSQGTSRSKARRGTVAQTDNSRLLGLKKSEYLRDENTARVSSAPMKQRPRRGSLLGNESTARSDKTGSLSARARKPMEGKKKTTDEKKKIKLKSKSSRSYKEQKGVSVSFYNENSDEESPIPVINIKKPDMTNLLPAYESSEEDSSQNEEKDAVWKEVLKCRYIRGYNPPEMRDPEVDTGTFVFGRNYNEVMDEQRIKANANTEAKCSD